MVVCLLGDVGVRLLLHCVGDFMELFCLTCCWVANECFTGNSLLGCVG